MAKDIGRMGPIIHASMLAKYTSMSLSTRLLLFFLLLAHCLVRTAEPDFRRTSIGILKDLMDVDPALGLKFIRQKLQENKDHFGTSIVAHVPQILRMGALDIIQQIAKRAWIELATRRRWRGVKNGLLLMFTADLATNLEALLKFVEEDNVNSAESIPALLEVWIQEQPYKCSYRLGALTIFPEELIHSILEEHITMAEELSLARTCHWLNDFLKPRIREKYKELVERSSRRKFCFSIRKIYKIWESLEEGSDKEAAAEQFLTRIPCFKQFETYLIYVQKTEFEKTYGYTCLFDDFISRHLHPEVLTLLIQRYPDEVLENFEAKHFVSAWYMDCPDYVLKAVIKYAEIVPSDVLYVVSDQRFSNELLEAVLKRFKWRLTVSECNYMLTRLRSIGMMEKVLDRLPNGFYRFSSAQIRHFLRMGLDNARLERLLEHFSVCLCGNGRLLEALLRRKLASGPLIKAILNSKKPAISSKTIELAIKLECSDEVLSVLIELAQKQHRDEIRVTSSDEDDSSGDDWVIRARTFGSGALDVSSVA